MTEEDLKNFIADSGLTAEQLLKETESDKTLKENYSKALAYLIDLNDKLLWEEIAKIEESVRETIQRELRKHRHLELDGSVVIPL